MSLDTTENEETETKLVASDEMELNISQILDKIESFTQTVSCVEIIKRILIKSEKICLCSFTDDSSSSFFSFLLLLAGL